jgi:hypothetical protein
MEMIESIVWIMTGFISTLVTMEVAWRLAKTHARKVSVTKPIAMEQLQRTTDLNSLISISHDLDHHSYLMMMLTT